LLIWLTLKNLSQKEKEEVIEALYKTNYGWLFVCFLLSVLSNISRAIRWKMLITPLNHQPKLSNTFFALMIGYLANYAFPRLGEVTRCGILSKYEKIPFNVSFGTVIAERAIDLITLMLIFLITFLWQFERISTYTHQKILSPIALKLNSLWQDKTTSAILFILLIIGLSALVFFLKKRQKSPIFLKIKSIIKGFWEGLSAIKKLKNPVAFIFHSTFIWSMYFLMNYVGFNALQQTAHLGMDAGLAVLVFGSIGMIAVQGGIGAFPVLVMETLGLYNISPSIGFAFGWVAWSMQTFSILTMGFLSLLLLPFLNKKNPSQKGVK